MNPNPGIAAIPIRAVAPSKSTKKWERKSSTHKNQPYETVTSRDKTSKKKSTPNVAKGNNKSGATTGINNPYTEYEEANYDFSGVPQPFCSCSGFNRVCYRAGPGGWQSSCCTNSMSQYPLPMSPMKPGRRVTGRKMSKGAYRKVLCKLAWEGQDLSHPVDLKDHWAKHGTNKFVTIK